MPDGQALVQERMADLAELLASRAPRYTSYPTAAQFGPAIGPAAYADWLAGLDPAQPVSLYLHIPFCKAMCWFCGCHTRVANTYGPVTAYLDVLHREIEMVAALAPPGLRAGHVHWGGGSPTILAPDDVRRLAERLHTRFAIAPGAEFAVEVDPRGMPAPLAAAFRDTGVNRASLGIQDVSPDVLAAVNRRQNFAATRRTVDLLRDAGVESLNVDLMYGLPHQTADHIRRTVEAALTLAPDRLAVFGYAHLPSLKRHQALIDESALPGPGERLRQHRLVRTLLQDAGYRAIGLDHFAKETDALSRAHSTRRLARNFQGYTTDAAPALIGFGASAIGAFPEGYVQNAAEVPAYRAAVLAGRPATARGVALTSGDRVRRAIIEELMCYGEVDVALISARFGREASEFAGAFARLRPCAQDGLVEIRGAAVRVPEEAQPALRLVCAAFDQYLTPAAARHAPAV